LKATTPLLERIDLPNEPEEVNAESALLKQATLAGVRANSQEIARSLLPIVRRLIRLARAHSVSGVTREEAVELFGRRPLPVELFDALIEYIGISVRAEGARDAIIAAVEEALAGPAPAPQQAWLLVKLLLSRPSAGTTEALLKNHTPFLKVNEGEVADRVWEVYRTFFAQISEQRITFVIKAFAIAKLTRENEIRFFRDTFAVLAEVEALAVVEMVCAESKTGEDGILRAAFAAVALKREEPIKAKLPAAAVQSFEKKIVWAKAKIEARRN
jgi:hypothetical protein